MVGDKGKKMRKNIMEMKKKAEEDTRPGGCSYMNLEKVIKEMSYLTNGYLVTKVDWIPGLRNIRLKDLLDFIRTTDPNDKFYH
ncbi:putative 7-deoxyloganetin glucosyltransferase [Medicago truncatula]|uniref:Putative 7-deoxyloganetin glucosyltransferase n=1 Tax=Medicago truncatula TaxID=3880 RepID=A0A396HGX6_MEDTR|nr:putative 7-deoxyloganetin glucosyltransferase [Medicago truncatula]